jgi:DNA mismatch endonuclease, patch repair protein
VIKIKQKSKDTFLSRDIRPPSPSSRAVTNVMKANIASDTKPELLMRTALREAGHSRYRLNLKNIPGRPDIAYPKKKIAIFVNGCFWHHCPYCKNPIPKSNTDYWTWKFARNKERDRRKKRELEKLGWKVFVFWECKIKKDAIKYAKKVNDYLEDEGRLRVPNDRAPKRQSQRAPKQTDKAHR